jgi:hypothetical protein
VELVELLEELVDLSGVQVELVERECHLFLRQETGVLPLADERLGGVLVQHHAFRSIPSPLFQADPSSDRIDGPRFVNGAPCRIPRLCGATLARRPDSSPWAERTIC